MKKALTTLTWSFPAPARWPCKHAKGGRRFRQVPNLFLRNYCSLIGSNPDASAGDHLRGLPHLPQLPSWSLYPNPPPSDPKLKPPVPHSTLTRARLPHPTSGRQNQVANCFYSTGVRGRFFSRNLARPTPGRPGGVWVGRTRRSEGRGRRCLLLGGGPGPRS